MKKIFQVLLVIPIMFCTVPTSVFADERKVVETLTYPNATYTLYENGDFTENKNGVFTEYVNIDNSIYRVDGDSYTLIFKSTFIPQRELSINFSPLSTTESNWSGVTKQKFGPVKTMADEGLLAAGLLSTGLGWVGIVTTVASYIIAKSNSYDNVYITQDYQSYIGCSILTYKSNIKIYKYSNYTGLMKTYSEGKYGWLGNPDNYSYPAVCRVAERAYPY